MRETGRGGFKAALIKELEYRFPGCVVLHMDPNSTHQGIPDVLILYKDRWAMLEVKASATARRRPNQAFFVDLYGAMSFAAFICPENEEDVLNDLQQSFEARRRPRVLKR